jgi:flagellar protein FliS
MLYDEAVKSLDRALEMLGSNARGKKNPENIERISNAILKTQEIITELTVSLDFEQGGEIAQNLFALYTWFNKELVEANIAQDVGKLIPVRNLLSELKSAWTEIAATNSHEVADKVVSGVNIAG